jgi:hypothetical protein
MSPENLQQLKTFCTWLEQFSCDVQVLLEPEQARLDNMPPGFSEVKLKERVEHLGAAAEAMEAAHWHLTKVAFEHPTATVTIEIGPRP